MKQTSINIQPIKGSSEAHNLREKELDYVNKELTPTNESFSEDSVSSHLEEIKAKYTETTGQQMQKKATPIREGVVVIQKETTMEQLQQFSENCESKFGIRAFQIHIHRDEGHKDILTQEWKPNLHAHIVFDWTDKNTGKSIKLNRQDMSELQTMCAESLCMARGITSDKIHLSAMQFKALETEKAILNVSTLIESKENVLESLKIEIKTIQVQENVTKTVSKAAEKIGDLFGKTKNDREKEELKHQVQKLTESNKVLGAENSRLTANNNRLDVRCSDLQRNNKSLDSRCASLDKELHGLKKETAEFFSKAPREQLQSIQAQFPALHKAITYGIRYITKQINDWTMER
jgi:hypothetical protein